VRKRGQSKKAEKVVGVTKVGGRIGVFL